MSDRGYVQLERGVLQHCGFSYPPTPNSAPGLGLPKVFTKWLVLSFAVITAHGKHHMSVKQRRHLGRAGKKARRRALLTAWALRHHLKSLQAMGMSQTQIADALNAAKVPTPSLYSG